MKVSSGKLFVELVAKHTISAINEASPYRWLDKRYEKKQKSETDQTKKKELENHRLLVSELYIVGWFGLALLLIAINQWLPILLVYFLMLRIIGILNKEIGVVVFKIGKISEGDGLSSPGRVIVLLFINYLTAGMLYALLYTKQGQFQLGSTATVSSLPTGEAILQSLSILLTFNPIYAPQDFYSNVLTLSQSAFSFVFVILIISSFVSVIRFNAKSSNNLP
jgi:hypothetical protein